MPGLADLLFALARAPRTLRGHLATRGHRRTMRDTPRHLAGEMPEGTIGKIVGGGVREPDPDDIPQAYRDGSTTRLCFRSTSKFPLLISDDPRAL